MLAGMNQSIPTQHTAGDTFTATVDGSSYSAADGWVAQLVLIGAARYTLTSTASGADHAVVATAAATAAWAPGAYALRAIYTKATTSERSSADLGPLSLLPDPASGLVNDVALKSAAQIAYEALRDAYRAYTAAGQIHVAEYSIAGRTMKFRSAAELLTALNAAARDVQAEQTAAKIAAGQNPRARFVVRM